LVDRQFRERKTFASQHMAKCGGDRFIDDFDFFQTGGMTCLNCADPARTLGSLGDLR
jgi:hypothetical protein